MEIHISKQTGMPICNICDPKIQQFFEEVIMKICPRCHRQSLHEENIMNSISHIGNNIPIYSECGKQQRLVGIGYCSDPVEIKMEKRFNEELS